jgi:hypothetical protein
MTITVEDHLQAFLAQHGEEAWRSEIHRLVVAALQTQSEQQEAFWRSFTKDFDWLKWEQLEAQAQASAQIPADRLIAETLKREMPGLKSQAQYNAVVGAMQAVQLLINALLDRDKEREQEARKALDIAFETVSKATELTLKLEDVPEAAQSDKARIFKDAPQQFQEAEIQASLLSELAKLTSVDKLTDWYERTRDKRDRLMTQSLRDALFDAVRAKRRALMT